MKYLGIDYGRRKIGLAIGDTDSKLTEPHSVFGFKNYDEAIQKVIKIPGITQVVLGISEGKMGEESKTFGVLLEKKLGHAIIYQDESLSSLDAREMSISAGINRNKRKRMEDAYAAAIMLQGYLDNLQ
jgi:putative Holliday junction resolvase